MGSWLAVKKWLAVFWLAACTIAFAAGLGFVAHGLWLLFLLGWEAVG